MMNFVGLSELPKKADGTLDYNSAMTGDDLRDFVNSKLFPHLASFKQTAKNLVA